MAKLAECSSFTVPFDSVQWVNRNKFCLFAGRNNRGLNKHRMVNQKLCVYHWDIFYTCWWYWEFSVTLKSHRSLTVCLSSKKMPVMHDGFSNWYNGKSAVWASNISVISAFFCLQYHAMFVLSSTHRRVFEAHSRNHLLSILCLLTLEILLCTMYDTNQQPFHLVVMVLVHRNCHQPPHHLGCFDGDSHLELQEYLASNFVHCNVPE